VLHAVMIPAGSRWDNDSPGPTGLHPRTRHLRTGSDNARRAAETPTPPRPRRCGPLTSSFSMCCADATGISPRGRAPGAARAALTLCDGGRCVGAPGERTCLPAAGELPRCVCFPGGGHVFIFVCAGCGAESTPLSRVSCRSMPVRSTGTGRSFRCSWSLGRSLWTRSPGEGRGGCATRSIRARRRHAPSTRRSAPAALDGWGVVVPQPRLVGVPGGPQPRQPLPGRDLLQPRAVGDQHRDVQPRDREPTDRHAPGGRLRGRAGVHVVGTVRQASAAGDGHWVSNRTDGVCIAYVSRTFPEGGSACRWRRTGRRLLPLPSPPRTGRTENRRVVAPAERRRRARARPPCLGRRRQAGTRQTTGSPAPPPHLAPPCQADRAVAGHLPCGRDAAASPKAARTVFWPGNDGGCVRVGMSVVVEGTVSPGLTYCLQGRSFG
jgi:hypothetical protein